MAVVIASVIKRLSWSGSWRKILRPIREVEVNMEAEERSAEELGVLAIQVCIYPFLYVYYYHCIW